MILNKKEIEENILNKNIIVKDENLNDVSIDKIKINPNSIDVKLHNILKTYYPFIKLKVGEYYTFISYNSLKFLVKKLIQIEKNCDKLQKLITETGDLKITEEEFLRRENFPDVKYTLNSFFNKYKTTIKTLYKENIEYMIYETIKDYKTKTIIDIQKKNKSYTYIFKKNEKILLLPDILYLGVTKECIGSEKFVPMYEGRSSTGRAGISSHVTAGFGDIGYVGYWTLEIWTLHPTIIVPEMYIGQVYFYKTNEKIEKTSLYKGKYSKQLKPMPVETKLWKEFTN